MSVLNPIITARVCIELNIQGKNSVTGPENEAASNLCTVCNVMFNLLRNLIFECDNFRCKFTVNSLYLRITVSVIEVNLKLQADNHF